jgi:hypothetical protein
VLVYISSGGLKPQLKERVDSLDVSRKWKKLGTVPVFFRE